jgi:anaerobic selenocysteine-containing dehydrogenase
MSNTNTVYEQSSHEIAKLYENSNNREKKPELHKQNENISFQRISWEKIANIPPTNLVQIEYCETGLISGELFESPQVT